MEALLKGAFHENNIGHFAEGWQRQDDADCASRCRSRAQRRSGLDHRHGPPRHPDSLARTPAGRHAARAEVRLERLASGLATLEQQRAAFCFIDTAPTISQQTEALIALADLVVVPVRPSPSDLWAVTETVQLVKDAGKPFVFVITQAKPQASITAQAVAALSEHGRVAQSFIVDRVGYASATTGGNTAPEITPKGWVAVEIANLWQELKSAFQQNSKARKVANG